MGNLFVAQVVSDAVPFTVLLLAEKKGTVETGRSTVFNVSVAFNALRDGGDLSLHNEVRRQHLCNEFSGVGLDVDGAGKNSASKDNEGSEKVGVMHDGEDDEKRVTLGDDCVLEWWVTVRGD